MEKKNNNREITESKKHWDGNYDYKNNPISVNSGYSNYKDPKYKQAVNLLGSGSV
jgi:hypothetical protein